MTFFGTKQERIVVTNTDWVVVVPFWAVWPYETMVLPKKHVKRITDLTLEQIHSLADIIKQITIKYDNLFKVSFPYSMGWHGKLICTLWLFLETFVLSGLPSLSPNNILYYLNFLLFLDTPEIFLKCKQMTIENRSKAIV